MASMTQTVMAAVGALVLTVTAVAAAVGPAQAVEAAPTSLVAATNNGQAHA